MNYWLIILVMVVIGASTISAAYAHTTVEVGKYSFEVGWGIEPPVVGIRNDFVIAITESPSEGVKTGITNAFRNIDATAKFGGVSKKLDINSDPRPGHYFSPVIPTKLGSISIEFKGELNGVPVDVDIPIEDVESTAVLDFPPRGASSDLAVSGLKNAMTALQKDVNDIQSRIGNVKEGSNLDAGPAYDFAVFGMALGAAGVILAVVAMVKRK